MSTYGNEIWISQNKIKYRLSEMKNSHLFNTLRMVFDAIAPYYNWPAIRNFAGAQLSGWPLKELEQLFDKLLTEFSEREFIKQLSEKELNQFNTMLLYMNTMRGEQIQTPILDDHDYSYDDEDVPF